MSPKEKNSIEKHKFSVGHQGGGQEDYLLASNKLRDFLTDFLDELQDADDEHYQIYVVNSADDSITIFDGGLMVLDRELSSTNMNSELFCRPRDFDDAVELLFALIERRDDMIQSRFEKKKPPSGGTFNPARAKQFPLHKAAQAGNSRLVKELLKEGFDVNELDDEFLTPLMLAASEERDQICKVLIEKGAKTDVPRQDPGYMKFLTTSKWFKMKPKSKSK